MTSEKPMTLQQRLFALQSKIDALQLRERVVVFLAVLVLLLGVFYIGLIEPLMKKSVLLERQLQSVKSSVDVQRIEKQQLEMLLAAGVNSAKIAHREDLKQQLEHLDKRIEQTVKTLIPPKLMPMVLEKLLLENDKLVLLSLENRPVKALVNQTPVTDSSTTAALVNEPASHGDNQQTLYKHSFVIKLRGGYPATVAYFEALAALPWHFNWDVLHYEVLAYPEAVITLEVHTISLSEGWIGV